MIQYTIGLVWSREFEEYCLIIRDERTGKILNMKQYEEWIKIIGGFEKERAL